jgi:hypothetical protein
VPNSVDESPNSFGAPTLNSLIDTDNDSNPDFLDTDSNNDGSLDIDENGFGNLDSNGDGMIDDVTDADGDGIPDNHDGNDAGFGGGGSGPILSFSGDTATGTGVAIAVINGGGSNCGFDLANTAFVPTNSIAADAPTENEFVHGLLGFTLTQCAPGAVVDVTVTWPGAAFPTGTEFWKYGPVSAGAGDTWFQPASTVINATTNETSYSVVNNGEGDRDNDVNTIADPFGPAIPGAGVAPPPPPTPTPPFIPAPAQKIPTLSEWGRIMLMLLIGVAALIQQGRRRKDVAKH